MEKELARQQEWPIAPLQLTGPGLLGSIAGQAYGTGEVPSSTVQDAAAEPAEAWSADRDADAGCDVFSAIRPARHPRARERASEKARL